MVLYQGPGDPPRPSWVSKWTPKWTLSESIQVPSMVHIGHLFLQRPLDNRILKFTAWFEVNPTFGPGEKNYFDFLGVHSPL